MVDHDGAELVDEDRRVAKSPFAEQAVQHRRLAASEEPGQHEDGEPAGHGTGRGPGGGRGPRAVLRGVAAGPAGRGPRCGPVRGVRGVRRAGRRRDADPETGGREARVRDGADLAERFEDRSQGFAVERPARRGRGPPPVRAPHHLQTLRGQTLHVQSAPPPRTIAPPSPSGSARASTAHWPNDSFRSAARSAAGSLAPGFMRLVLEGRGGSGRPALRLPGRY